MIAPSRHQVAVEMRQNDFERIEELGADAMDAARLALDTLVKIDGFALSRELNDLRKIVADRAALSQTSRFLLADAVAAIHPLIETDPTGLIVVARDHLARCLRLSERVADLLAAERHVGFCRGIGR